MKFHTFPHTPNPRRVEIFAAEKGITLEPAMCNIMTLEQKKPEFLKKNPHGQIPVLELDDGRCIPESVAICRYLEAIEPEPNLFGRDAYEIGFIDARNRQMEFSVWREVGKSWVNGPIVGRSGRVKQIPEVKEASDARAKQHYETLDKEFASSAYVAGDRFTVADITLLTAIDFASSLVFLKPDESLKNLYRWHTEVSSRPSVQKHPVVKPGGL